MNLKSSLIIQITLLVALNVSLASDFTRNQTTPPYKITAAELSVNTPVIDGDLSDPCWQDIKAVSSFWNVKKQVIAEKQT
ncbi:MAG: hypothetical protein ACYTFY_22490, partial [Planctomycetota bacterium]